MHFFELAGSSLTPSGLSIPKYEHITTVANSHLGTVIGVKMVEERGIGKG